MTFVDIIGDIVTGVRTEYDSDFEQPFYLYGHPQDIFEILADKDKSTTYKSKKYPMICLFQDFEEETDLSGTTITNPTIVICTETSKEYRAKDRYDNIFTPVLQPLYVLFIKYLRESQYLANDDEWKHTKIDRLYWGKSDEFGNTAGKTNDSLDAIVISGLTLGIIPCKKEEYYLITESGDYIVSEADSLIY